MIGASEVLTGTKISPVHLKVGCLIIGTLFRNMFGRLMFDIALFRSSVEASNCGML